MDSDLVIRAQRGDLAAFHVLALDSHPRLFKVALGILRDAHLAEDATQQSLLDIWIHLRRLRDATRFEGWSYRVVVRACYLEHRRAARWLPSTSLQPGDEPLTADVFGRVGDRDQLERAFRRLSVEHRAVVVLHHLVGMSLEQVADALDIRVGTVKSRLHRAMLGLRAAVEADDRVATPRSTVSQEVMR